jgi:hypothetical protein
MLKCSYQIEKLDALLSLCCAYSICFFFQPLWLDNAGYYFLMNIKFSICINIILSTEDTPKLSVHVKIFWICDNFHHFLFFFWSKMTFFCFFLQTCYKCSFFLFSQSSLTRKTYILIQKLSFYVNLFMFYGDFPYF